MKSKGIGTKIYEVNKKLGINKVASALAKAVGKDDCGCKERAKRLDKLFQGNK